MLSTSRSTLKKIVTLAFIATLVCGFALGNLFLHSTPTLAASHATKATVYQSVTKGTLTPAGIANLQQAAATKAAHSISPQRSKGQRTIPRAHSNQATTHPAINPNSISLAHTGQIIHNFDGVSSLDSAVTNFGAEFEPPDQGLCVGNGFVVEPVNSAFTIYHTNGDVVLGPLNVNVLFNDGLTQFTSDPRCYFDKSTHTWIATILFIADDNASARTDIAVNHNPDPTTPWTIYHLDATDDGSNGTPNHDGCPCLGDQPLLGLDSENVYISTNEFSILGDAFNAAQVYAISKSQLFSLAKSVNFVHFDNLSIGGAPATSVQPATVTGNADGGFFLNSLDPFGTFDSRLGVWAVTNRANVTKGKLPTLSSLVITSEAYGIPPPAIQKGSDSPLDSGDDRMQQVQFINGNLWGALGTQVTIPNDTAPHAGIAWFKVHPSVENHLLSSAGVRNQGYIASLGNDVLYPAIQAGPDNTAAVVFTFTGPNNFPSAAYAVMREGHSSFDGIKIAASGTGSYDPNAGRWGDYSAAVLDPDHNRFWVATEYIPPVSSQTTDGRRNWGTRVFAIDGRS